MNTNREGRAQPFAKVSDEFGCCQLPTANEVSTVIRVENLGKCYTLKHQGQGQRSGDGFRHALQDAISAPFRRLASSPFRRRRQANLPTFPPSNLPTSEPFWALKDVSFEVNEGEVVGIIGRNGAGKSTLLKILSRITEPTTGRIGIKGRVASLLEVGTGFHPELTGRENIYLNGAILGMSRAEVKGKFDEIVDFSGVEKFLDTPVKRYSSGMYVRLAFAVAAHLEPEILIIDEVLAVGDAEFQKKCLGKMRDVASGGRTVLFVSHNLSAIRSLCTEAILMKAGRLHASGGVSDVARSYASPSDSTDSVQRRTPFSGKERQILSVIPQCSPFPAREPLLFDVVLSPGAFGANCHFSLHIWNDQQENVATITTEHLESGCLGHTVTRFSIHLDSPRLLPGDYHMDAYLYMAGIIDRWESAARFTVSDSVANGAYGSQSGKGCRLVLSEFSLTFPGPDNDQTVG